MNERNESEDIRREMLVILRNKIKKILAGRAPASKLQAVLEMIMKEVEEYGPWL